MIGHKGNWENCTVQHKGIFFILRALRVIGELLLSCD